MKFLEILLQNSSLKEAKLYGAARRAFENPSTGVTINNPAAAHVIKDCAKITLSYIPHFVFASFEKPFEQLHKKFSKENIKEFVDNSLKDKSLEQLLVLILDKAKKDKPNIFQKQVVQKEEVLSLDVNNPYGNYYSEEVEVSSLQQSPQEQEKTIEQILFEYFGVS